MDSKDNPFNDTSIEAQQLNAALGSGNEDYYWENEPESLVSMKALQRGAKTIHLVLTVDQFNLICMRAANSELH